MIHQIAFPAFSCRSDNAVKNHWNGGLSTAYRNRTLRTAYVRRQRTLLPLKDLMALLQVSPADGVGNLTMRQLPPGVGCPIAACM